MNQRAAPIVPPRVDFLDPRTGKISREWYRFLLGQFILTGSGSSDLTLVDLQVSPSNQVDIQMLSRQFEELQSGPSDRSEIQGLSQRLQDLQLASSNQTDSQMLSRQFEEFRVAPQPVEQAIGSPLSPRVITVGASPFVVVNTSAAMSDIIVSGSGITALDFSRDGVTWFSTGSFYGMFALSSFDSLRVTYTVAPLMTLIPR